ncbi:MAG: hypothetical protein ACFFC7_00200 [Candidatus Hermodarchaeota archaeon]
MNLQTEAVSDWWKIATFLIYYLLFQIGYSIVTAFSAILFLMFSSPYPSLGYLILLLIPLRFAIILLDGNGHK